MYTVGIVGPITPIGDVNHTEIFGKNAAVGIHAGALLIQHGFAPYCPHLDFQYLLTGLEITAGQLQGVSYEWIRHCDVVFALPGWARSEGSLAELQRARILGIHVAFTIEEVLQWRKNKEEARREEGRVDKYSGNGEFADDVKFRKE